MELLFEKSVKGRNCSILPLCDVPEVSVPTEHIRLRELGLPELSENDISRHYTALEHRTYGVNDGFYPLAPVR